MPDFDGLAAELPNFSEVLDDLRKQGSLAAGIPLEGGGTLRVEIYEERILKVLPPELRAEQSKVKDFARLAGLAGG